MTRRIACLSVSDEDRFNEIDYDNDYDPQALSFLERRRAMRPRRDERARRGVASIKPTPDALLRQEQLRAAAAEALRQEQARIAQAEVTVLSKTEARVDGTVVTLDHAAGKLSCAMHRGQDDCWHIQRLLQVAQPRRRS